MEAGSDPRADKYIKYLNKPPWDRKHFLCLSSGKHAEGRFITWLRFSEP